MEVLRGVSNLPRLRALDFVRVAVGCKCVCVSSLARESRICTRGRLAHIADARADMAIRGHLYCVVHAFTRVVLVDWYACAAGWSFLLLLFPPNALPSFHMVLDYFTCLVFAPVLYGDEWGFHVFHTDYVHCALTIAVLVVAFCPLDLFCRSTRAFLFSTLLSIFAAPFRAVQFRDFFIGDQLCSLIKVVLDVNYAVRVCVFGIKVRWGGAVY